MICLKFRDRGSRDGAARLIPLPSVGPFFGSGRGSMSRSEARLVGGRYQLVEPIGRGGMGVVWRAHDQLLDRAVAVKEVRYDSAMGDELSDLNRRTMREARAAGRLTHPNVVVVHDVIEEDDRPWIIMQLVQSRSLGQV